MQSRSSHNSKAFYGAVNAAKVIGVSVRQFRRISEDSGVPPIQIGRSHFWFWLMKDVEDIREYHDSIKRSRAID